MGAAVRPTICVDPAARLSWLHASILVLLFVAAFGLRLGTLTVRGEEPRWANVAREMVDGGDWVVPRLQGSPFLSRPPLHAWAIAVSAGATGAFTPSAIRFPSAVAVLLTTLLTYFYARRVIGPVGAFTAGLSFLTLAQVLELGRLAETDALFAFFVAASLMLWHACADRWSAGSWIVGYAICGLAAITKGPQAPVYFVGTACVSLAWRGDWRTLFSAAHLAGVLAFGAVVGVWQIPFLLRTDWDSIWRIWFADVAHHSSAFGFGATLRHLLTFPAEALLATLPWSACLVCLAARPVRRLLLRNDGPTRVAIIAVGLAFVSCWLPGDGQTRYLMPVYPMLAVLVGAAVEHSRLQPVASTAARILRRLGDSSALMMVVCGACVATLAVADPPVLRAWRQPLPLAVGYPLLAAACAGMVFWSGRSARSVAAYLGPLAVAVFMTASVAGVFVNKLITTSVDTAGAISEARARMGHGHRIVSLGPVSPVFAFYYGDPIGRIDALDAPELFEPGTFFCFSRLEGTVATPPFRWREVATIPAYRSVGSPGKVWVVIGQASPPG